MPESRKRIVELASSGIDESLQLIGGDPFGGSSAMGLRVPGLATPNKASRYLFNAASFSVGEGESARILGWRQLVTIGAKQGQRVIEQEVTSPVFRFSDGNVGFYLRRLGGPNSQGVPAPTPAGNVLPSTARGMSILPALLYQAITVPPLDGYYVDLTAYTPPNGGRPYGTAVEPGFERNDLATPWRTHGAWSSLDVKIEGPETIAMFISVSQTNAGTRTALTPPGTFYPGGLSAEEQFLLNFPTAVYWRVGASLIVEFQNSWEEDEEDLKVVP